MDRKEAISRIRKGLKKRSGRAWSVTGGRGTAWGWLTISSPPAKRIRGDYMPWEDRVELSVLLGLDRPVHQQGETIPASSDYWQEYIDRAEGRSPSVLGVPYWD